MAKLNGLERMLKYSIVEGLVGDAVCCPKHYINSDMADRDSCANDYWNEYYDATGSTGANLSQEEKFVYNLVSKHRVVVFSKTKCPHCSDSKTLLTGKGVNYKSVELDQLEEGGQVQNVLGQMTEARTVPRIFIDGQCVGGNSDLKNLNETGKLEKILSDFKF